MSNILNNIKLIAENEGLTITSFESKIGASKGVLSRAISNNTDIQSKWLLKVVENYPLYNPAWILTGQGSMLLKDSNFSNIKSDEISTVSKGIPLVEVKAVGGFGNSDFSITSQDVKEYYVIPKFKHKQIDFMIEVEGSSMYPKYNSGDIVACKVIRDSKFLQWNKTHVLATKEQGIIIKRLKEHQSEDVLTLVSDNESYPPFHVPKDEITGIALVVGVIRLE